MTLSRIKQAAFALCAGALLAGFTSRPAQAPAQSGSFPRGERAPAANFTGTVYLYPLVKDDPAFHCVSGNVTFEPGARSHWHAHAAGQILLITEGVGYYQEKGQPVRLLRKGDVIKALPGVEHWHGASPKQRMTHISLNVNTEKGIVTWLRPVTDQEYNSYMP